jgi:cytochrome c-type biogenesis protein CcmF
MNEIIYLGESLIWGNLGHMAVVLSFTASILSALAWYFAHQKNDASWEKIARMAFHTQSLMVLTIIGTLFYIIHQHMFEYHYAWQHSSIDLPVYYMISCFWEGQEGSFLLWVFWQMVIGNIMLHTSGLWTRQVMAVLMLSQIVLTSMLLGVEVLGYKIGSTPFELLRNAMAGAPLFSQPDYLSRITDGNGLNPLLQNYWMVIHPPTLFFGFATTIVPFAFAIAGLWKRDFTGWLKPALPWALVSVMVLGTGIIMGGFWAYESLSFGGYWAWDPVENASLIPWLILIAAVHVIIIYRHSGNALVLAFLLTIATFWLVLYATFLTRSGILGNASVHSFTDLGMSGQLLLFIMMFVWLPGFVLITNGMWKWVYSLALPVFIALIVGVEKLDFPMWPAIIIGLSFFVVSFGLIGKLVPKSDKDEEVYTREFWMFVGSLVMVISAFQVITTTSIPVVNALLGTKLAPPSDVIMHYNKWQMPIAILIAIFTGVAQLLKYKNNTNTGIRMIMLHAGIAIVSSIALFYTFELNNWYYFGLLTAAMFTISANVHMMKPIFSGKIKMTGSAVAHFGFGILLIGVLVSSANKEVISINQTQFQLNPEFDDQTNREHVLLERGKPIRMGNYELEYVRDTQIWVNTYYEVNYKKIDPQTNLVRYSFNLYPNAQVNPKMGLVANPDTKHYLSHDVFTYVSSIPKERETNKYINGKLHELRKGDTAFTNYGYVIVDNVVSNTNDPSQVNQGLDLMLTAILRIVNLNGTFEAAPIYGIREGQIVDVPASLQDLKLRIRFTGVDPSSGKITLETAELDTSGDFIIMKAIVFPWINLVWAGTIIMVIGFLLAIWRRLSERRLAA